LEKLTKLDLITQRYDNVLLALPTLKSIKEETKMAVLSIFQILSREIVGPAWETNSING
tara:strand:- start:499 stop:675 length:177 start_codon:yes stop_codon:yes gene_type:complete